MQLPFAWLSYLGTPGRRRLREASMNEPKKDTICPECDGTGQERGMRPVHLGEKIAFRACTKCGGSGRIVAASDA
ncbi:hypothetical protein C2U70_19435 [Bradyrhizobium guangdongense]|nr:hypothetical protein C2U70_19435 [Bradyrhizobium guangdongense]